MPLVTPTATGWSTFWGTTPGSYQLQGSNPVDNIFRENKRIASSGRRELRRIILTMLTATGAVGTTATESFAQVDGPDALTNSAALGGLRTINTVTTTNRVTTTADQTKLLTAFNNGYLAAPTSYPTDLSGNGGGGKLASGS